MKYTLLTAASALAITASSMALADNNNQKSHNMDNIPTVTQQDIEKKWNSVKETTNEAIEDTSDAVENVIEDVKSTFDDDNETAKVEKLRFDSMRLASEIIGSTVYNMNGERVAKIHDIILDSTGRAQQVVLADGDFTGLGKLVAYDYQLITTRNKDGDIVAALSEEMIDMAIPFAYAKDTLNIANQEVISQDNFSVAKLLDNSKLIDHKGKTLAYVDDITMQNGQAETLVVTYDQIMGFGGETVLMPFYEADITSSERGTVFELSATESALFKDFKETTMQ